MIYPGVMSANASGMAAETRPGPPGADLPRGAWLFRRPVLDAIFIACLFWPLLLLISPFEGTFGATAAICYVALVTPHRWVTLLLVFLDPDQLERRPRVYPAMFFGCFAMCLGAPVLGRALGVGLEVFYLLLAVDFVWNAWHFGSQHHGIYRIYGRLGGQGPMPAERLERWALRLFVMYVIFRVGASTLFDGKDFAHLLGWMVALVQNTWALDLAALCVPVWLVLRELGSGPIVKSRAIYLMSLLSLYSGLLIAVLCYEALGWAAAMTPLVACAMGITLFHSVEYMGIVTWSTTGKRDPRGAFDWIVRHWPETLVASITTVMILNALTLQINEEGASWWIAINLSVSLLHYAYDGMIWKRPREA